MQPVIHCKFDEMVDVSKLKDHDKNRNSHSKEQIERLAKLYSYHGIRHPIIVSKLSGKIAAGHGRKLAARKAGIKQMPVVYQDFVDETAEYAFLQADNAIAAWSELDVLTIKDDVADLGDFDLEMLGLKDFKIDILKEAMAEEDEVPEVVEPFSVLGDLYELGEHKLLCGDSTSVDAVEKLMGGVKADMVFTDPPYGMKFDAEAFGYKNVAGDHDDFSNDLIHSIFQLDCPEIFIWGADYFAELLPNRNEGAMLVWDKFPSDQNSDRIGSSFELCWSKAKHKRHIIKVQQPFGRFATKREHPTQKPVPLAEWFFNQWGKDRDSVVDLYGGSGSTLIACEKTNRKCFMMELDPHYVSVIIDRWCNYTGRKAYLVNEDGTKTEWDEIKAIRKR